MPILARPVVAGRVCAAIVAVVLLAAACRSELQPPPPVGSTPAVKLTVERDGIYAIAAETLRQAGLDLASVDPASLSLLSGGNAVAFEWVGAGRDRVLRFYGRVLTQPGLATRNVYWLGDASGAATPAPRAVAPASDVLYSAIGQVTTRVEEQHRYLPEAEPGGDRWFWASIFAPGDFMTTVNAVEPLDVGAILRVRFWAQSSAPANPDHHAVLSLNDTPVADLTWDGPGPQLFEAPLAAGVLRAGENRLRIALPGDTDAPADAVLLDWVEIAYSRRLALTGGVLEFEGSGPGFAVALQASPLRPGADVAVWDITDPAHALPLTDFTVTDEVLRFASDGTSRHFLVAAESDLLVPATVALAAAPAAPEWPGGADLLIVTAPQFRQALAPLIEARAKAGLRVAVFDVADLYDAFTHGRADPAGDSGAGAVCSGAVDAARPAVSIARR